MPELAREQSAQGGMPRQRGVSFTNTWHLQGRISRGLSISRQENKRQKREETIKNETVTRERKREAGGLF